VAGAVADAVVAERAAERAVLTRPLVRADAPLRVLVVEGAAVPRLASTTAGAALSPTQATSTDSAERPSPAATRSRS
jgi:hypothetical protein